MDNPPPEGAPVAAIDPGEVRSLIGALARPRRTGGPGAWAPAREMKDRFEQLGYQSRELPFAFSVLPGRLGVPFTGAALLATAAGAGWLLTGGQATASLAVLAAGLTLAALPLLFLGPALRLPWGRIETVNLLFTRETPRWIVMAHRDTKSQPVPTLGRTAALALGLAAWAGLAGMAVLGLDGGDAPLEPVLAVAGTLGAVGALMVLSPSGDASPGALDNGTGLAALLALAARTPPEVAFLVTDGEELGLAGARAVVDQLPRVDGIINLDGLDDQGPVRIAERRGRGSAAAPVADALEREARELGIDVVRRPLPPFVLVDHEPLAAAGLPALTLLKGTWRSLLRVHRPADTAERLDGTGTAAVATLVLATLRRLTDAATDTLRADDRSGHSPAL